MSGAAGGSARAGADLAVERAAVHRDDDGFDGAAERIVRLRSFGPMAGRMDLGVSWSNGPSAKGAGVGPAPAGSGATSYMILRHPSRANSTEDPPYDEAWLPAYIAEREGRR